MADTKQLWERYQAQLFVDERLGFSIDVSRMDLDDAFFAQHAALTKKAHEAMAALERGAIANPDEQRMVGHYWLRAPTLAPNAELRAQIEDTLGAIHRFAADVHSGRLSAEDGGRFQNLLVVGIGGSALGPQLVADALGGANDRMRVFFFDNTDPDGIDRVLEHIDGVGGLARTLTIVISKSGGTKETRNGMVEAQAAYAARGLSPSAHFVAVIGEGSELDRVASSQQWIARFPMWDWVGGRTSVLSAVGLLPAALQGFDVRALLDGARRMDEATRGRDAGRNPAAILALAWHHATRGRGEKDMVVLPYKDRLELFSRYLQQLVMESLGKERDLDGDVVRQGIAVYGNKGSTDQHAYVQQLREGVDNFFVTFVEALRERDGEGLEVEPGVTAGDYLFGFLEGTRRALHENGRASMTVTLPDVSPRSVGALIALYERAVGLYASLVHVNAYHQPGVEAGKKAAGAVVAAQARVLAALRAGGRAMEAPEVAAAAGVDAEMAFRVLLHLSGGGQHGVTRERAGGGAGRFRAS